MPFKRKILPEKFATGKQLTQTLRGLGFKLPGRKRLNGNIEDTLIAASLEALPQENSSGDLRVLALLVDWFFIHYERINADRLINMIKEISLDHNQLFKAFWIALAQALSKDARFKRLVDEAPKESLFLFGPRTEFLICKNGEDQRFKSTCLRVPQKTLRQRPADILTPAELAEIHLYYRYRILLGPSYRADMWALLSQCPDLSASEIARQCYGSYPTAYLVKQEIQLLHGMTIKLPELSH